MNSEGGIWELCRESTRRKGDGDELLRSFNRHRVIDENDRCNPYGLVRSRLFPVMVSVHRIPLLLLFTVDVGFVSIRNAPRFHA